MRWSGSATARRKRSPPSRGCRQASRWPTASVPRSKLWRSLELVRKLVPYRSKNEERRRSEEHTSELQSLTNLVCRLLLEKKNKKTIDTTQQHNNKPHREINH